MALQKHNPQDQLWILIKIKDGEVYTGEFDQIMFRTKEKSRELLLRHVTHHQDYGKPTCRQIPLSYMVWMLQNAIVLRFFFKSDFMYDGKPDLVRLHSQRRGLKNKWKHYKKL